MAEVSLAGIAGVVPVRIIDSFAAAAEELGETMFLCGGAVRDLIMDRTPADLDFTVAKAGRLAVRLARELPATLVVLDEQEEAWRLVWKGINLDLTGLRGDSLNIDEDLGLRDFTVNAMAVAIDRDFLGRGVGPVIDPAGGLADIAAGVVRMVSEQAFVDDPLRRLRAFRFAATLGFSVDSATLATIGALAGSMAGVAAERISHELELLMASGRGAAFLELMRDNGLLAEVLPELIRGAGVAQPASHHLDVLDHGLAALAAVEEVMADPGRWYGDAGDDFTAWLDKGDRKKNLRWAALMHDIGKPACFAMKGERITFYNHDQAGAEEVVAVGRRLRWSKRQREGVAHLVRLHMWPFHLNNARKKTGIRPRACLRLYRAAGESLAGLFLLAMADSIAGRGPGRPEAMEEDLAALYMEVSKVVEQRIRPVRRSRPLLTGHDLKDMGIAPGPVYRRILDGIEEARVAGEVVTCEDAVALVERLLSELQES